MEKIGLHIVIKNGKIVWKHGPTTQKSTQKSNIQSLPMVLYKVKKHVLTHIMREIFLIRNADYNLRTQIDFAADYPNM